jgi:hypothetical protein
MPLLAESCFFQNASRLSIEFQRAPNTHQSIGFRARPQLEGRAQHQGIFIIEPAMNPIAAENALAGNDSSEWDVNGSGDPTIQGFSTRMSLCGGETLELKVDTDASNYRVDIYRLGYYGGLGARKVDTVSPCVVLPQLSHRHCGIGQSV